LSSISPMTLLNGMIIRIDGRPLIHIKQVAGDKTPTLTEVQNWFKEFKKMPSRDSDIDLLVIMTRIVLPNEICVSPRYADLGG